MWPSGLYIYIYIFFVCLVESHINKLFHSCDCTRPIGESVIVIIVIIIYLTVVYVQLKIFSYKNVSKTVF